MPLPKTDKPLFDLTIPSLNKKVKFRPFLVKEEKILLMALQSDEDKDLVDACRQIINNCIQDSSVDIEKLATFDLDYIFMKLRARSVNNMLQLAYEDLDDKKTYKFEVDLNDIEVTFKEGHSNKIKINDEITMMMKYPTMSVAEDMLQSTSSVEMIDKMVINCVDKIYDDETVYEDYSDEELIEFLDELDVATFDQIRLFFDTMPNLKHVIEYTNANGLERRIVLSSIRDFFMHA